MFYLIYKIYTPLHMWQKPNVKMLHNEQKRWKNIYVLINLHVMMIYIPLEKPHVKVLL